MLTLDEFEVTKKELKYETNLQVISPTGKEGENFLLFLRNGQVYYTPLSSVYVEAMPLGYLPVQITSFRVRSNVIAYEVNVYPEFGDHLILTQMKDSRQNGDYKVYNTIDARSYNTWKDGKVPQIFTQNILMNFSEKNITTQSSPTNRMKMLDKSNTNFSHLFPKKDKGSYIEIPKEILGGGIIYDLNQEGTELAFTGILNTLKNYLDDPDIKTTRTDNYAHDKSLENINTWRLFKSSLSTGYVTLLSHSQNGKCHTPKFVGSSDKIMFLDNNHPNSHSTGNILKIYEAGAVREFNFDESLSISNYEVFNENLIMFTSMNKGYIKLGYLRLDVPYSSPVITHDSENDVQSIAGNLIRLGLTNDVIAMRSSFKHTPELYSFTFKAFDIEKKEYPKFKQITDVNKDYSINKRFGDFVDFTYKNKDGIDIQAFLVKPVNFDEKIKYPLIIDVHGGPEYAHLSLFVPLAPNPQLISSDKYLTLLVNPTGTEGFGEKFKGRIRGNWGDAFNDIIDGIINVKSTFKDNVDFDKKCLRGISFGGFTANYARGKIYDLEEERKVTFNCYISYEGIFSTRMFAYEMVPVYLMLQEFCSPGEEGCKPYDPKYSEKFDEFSAEKNIAKWDNAPHLVIHSQDDYIVPWSDGVALFNTLQGKKIKSKFLFYKKEGHLVVDVMNNIKQEEVINEFIAENISTPPSFDFSTN